MNSSTFHSRRAIFPLIFLFAASAARAFGPGLSQDNPFLGCGPRTFPASGFFRVEEKNGRWWFVTPDGRPFLSLGVNHITYEGYYCPPLGYSPYQRAAEKLYRGKAGWAEKTRERLLEWGFNTLGSWSDYRALAPFPYTLNLNLSRLGGADWRTGKFLDVFAPEWEAAVKDYCQKVCGPRKDDPWLIGYFTDNELHWGPDWRGLETLLSLYLALPESSPGRQEAERFRGEFKGGRKQAELEFARVVARRYFQVCANAIREADPNHLLLGCRFHALGAPAGVVEEAGRFMDAVSVNFYDMLPRAETALAKLLGNVPMAPDWLETYHRLSGRPLLLTEFSYRAMDSGLPNTMGAGSVVLTQKQRADRFERYALKSLERPYIVGLHWFNYMDEPFLGRFDGENGNYGLVDGKDRPYLELTSRMKKNLHTSLRDSSRNRKKPLKMPTPAKHP